MEVSYLHQILEMVEQYDGPGIMFWRPIIHPDMSDPVNYPNGKIDPVLEAKIFEQCLANKDKSYQGDASDMVWSMFAQDAVCWNALFGATCCERFGTTEYDEEEEKKRTQDVFCSELVAAIFIQVGILEKDWHADRYLPKDLSSDPNSNLDDHLATIEYTDKQTGQKVAYRYSVGTEFKLVRKLTPGYSWEDSASTGRDKEMEKTMSSGSGAMQGSFDKGPQHEVKQRKTFTV